jgi:prepilin-type N-terminal cleavage/methylation domain-containing protein
MRRQEAFTLVEIMIVVAVIAVLAAIAVPSLLRARERTRRTKFVAALRVARDACDLYAAEHNGYPVDVNRGVLPPQLRSYFDGKFDWVAPTPIGGRWDWDYKNLSFTAGVSVVGTSETTQTMAEIDELIDDGDLSTGSFQRTQPDRYTYIIEK